MSNNQQIDIYAPDFELPGIDQQVYHLTRYRQQYSVIAVVFLAHDCPVVLDYLPRLCQLQDQFNDQGVTLVGINANNAEQTPPDSLAEMQLFSQERGLNFPYLRDSNQDVARSFGVTVTPEVFLLEQSGMIRYHGAIDDCPSDPTAVQQPYLKNAIAALLAGKAVPLPETSLKGSPLILNL